MPLPIAISIGDLTGVGPEVTLKALALELDKDEARYLLIGDEPHLRRLNDHLGLQLPLQGESGAPGRVLIATPVETPGSASLSSLSPPNLSPGAPVASRAAVAWLAEGARRCLQRQVAALVTAPVSKEAIIRSGQAFVGQTEFLSQMAGTDRTIMMLLGADDRGRWLRVALATTHLPLKRVSENLSSAKIELAIQLAAKACADLGLDRARVAVCGLNPHAGEGGARRRGFEVTGPLAADTLFHYAWRGDYDAIVAMYHDQGLVALKMIGFDTGVNWTLGLPFIRTSPDHGTAYDIAGKGLANPSSMVSALRLAKQLASGRTSPD
jgi:4-hydroxythreonine-4-phosphate dehydrogenase